MIFGPGDRIVFVGDSITDAGRRSQSQPYGDGYVDLVRSFVTARHPELGLSWLNRGVSGDTVRDLRDRWTRDAIDANPDWLSVMIGINDVWRFFDGSAEYAVPLDEFRTTLAHLLESAVAATGCRLILADPYLIEPDPLDPQRAMTEEYARAVGELAGECDAVHVPTQAAFDRVLATSSPTAWAEDRIHPNRPGHAVIAQAFLSAAGWDLGGRADRAPESARV